MAGPEFSFSPLDLAIIGLYAAEDYFLAGRNVVWPLVGISLFASNISSTTLVGLAGDAYTTGISVFNYEWMAALVLAFYPIFLAPAVLRSRVFTMPEFLERRYDGRVRTGFSLLTLFLNIVVDTAGSLYAGAVIFRLVLPEVPIWQSVAALAILAGFYTILGGLKAVIYTDAMQGVLLVVGSIVITLAAWSRIGGWREVVAEVPAEKLSLIRPVGDPGVPWPGLLLGVSLLGFYFWCTNQFMAQRLLAARNLDHARWGSLFAGFLKLPVLFIMVLPGTFALLLYPELSATPDLVYPTLLFDLLWGRANEAGAFTALVAGLASGGVLFWLVVVEQASDLHFLYAAPMLFAVSVSVLVVVSLATSAEPREDVEELLWTPRSFSNESAQLRGQPYWKNYRLLGIALLVVTALLVATFW